MEIVRSILMIVAILEIIRGIHRLIWLKKYNIGGACPYFPNGCSDMTDYGCCGRHDGNKRCPNKLIN